MEEQREEKKISAMESVYARNEQLAKALNEKLTAGGTFAANVMGAPGAGKTSVLTGLIGHLGADRCFVIEGDIESDIDARAMRSLGVETHQINTGGACHLDSPAIAEVVEKLDIRKPYLFIENIGNLVCPAEFMIGEHVKILVCSVTEGSDKPYKYPLAFEKADILVVNKIDLVPYVSFDEDYFTRGVRALNRSLEIFRVSCTGGEGLEELAKCVERSAKRYTGR